MAITENIPTSTLFHRWSNPTLYSSTLPSKTDHYLIYPNQSSSVSAGADSSQAIPLTYSALGLFLSLFCFITVFGNGLVIYAIVQERYLKSATYYYMGSLACADLLVGLVVMPFAIVQVIYGEYWPFGRLCCDLWHSIDVCASTASILDLCVIALDRYSAITNPISYHQTFFVRRWPYLLVAVWLCSGLISFPAVAYWRLAVRNSAADRCSFPDDMYYIVFSSLISFYIPLFVMIFVYIRIYRAAIKQLHAFKTGVKVASPTNKRKKKKKNGSKTDEPPEAIPPDICLRIHRGKYHGVPSLPRDSSSLINPLETTRTSNLDEHLTLPIPKSISNSIRKSISDAFSNDHQNMSLSRFSMPTLVAPMSATASDHHHNQQSNLQINVTSKHRHSQETISAFETPRVSKTNPQTSAATSLGKRLTKFSKEQKATITLAYVMGIFVICWLPFFVYNPLTAIAKLFTSSRGFLTGNDLVFQMFTWFGFVNSSVNPIIYAYSSREFRRAFIKYLCRCFPIRIRNFMMSYHNLHLLRYRRAPESNMSKENIESGSDNPNHNHNNNNNNNNNLLKSSPLLSPSTPASSTILSTLPSKIHPSKRTKTKAPETRHSRLCLFSHCCREQLIRETGKNQQDIQEKRSSSTTSSRGTVPTNILVDYCTYHDVAISRVTCL